MKTFVAAFLGFALAAMAQGQSPVVQPPLPLLSREELKDLAGPIALYPDPLIALILPASTYPADVVMAARFAASGDDPSLVDGKPWDDSIKALVRYPEVLAWMDENLEWTTQLGDAYLAQPEDVMDAIQDLRALAADLGNLTDTPQQVIVREEQYIRIVPAQPEYIYVPQYVPEVVYYERPVAQPLLTFSVGCLVGSWLRYDFDWHQRRLYCGDWHHHDWDYHHDRDRFRDRGDVRINNYITNYQVWNADDRKRSAAVKRVAGVVERGLVSRQTSTRPPEPARGSGSFPADTRGPRFDLPKPKPHTGFLAGQTVRRATPVEGERTTTPPGKGSFTDRDGRSRPTPPRSTPPVVRAEDAGGKGKPQGSGKPLIVRGQPSIPEIRKVTPAENPPGSSRIPGDSRPKTTIPGVRDNPPARVEGPKMQVKDPRPGTPDRPKIVIPDRRDAPKVPDMRPKGRVEAPKTQITDPRPTIPERPKIVIPERRDPPKPTISRPPTRVEPPKVQPKADRPRLPDPPKMKVPERREMPKPKVATPPRPEPPKPQPQSQPRSSDKDKDKDKRKR